MTATILNEGSVVIFAPEDKEAQSWLEENTDGMWYGGGLVVEPRYLENLIAGFMQAGGSVGYK